jgi:hypothetical protein
VPDPARRSSIDGEVEENLPAYWFAAEFYDGGMARCLVVVWFQHQPAPIPTEEARAKLEAVDWANHAEEFTP